MSDLAGRWLCGLYLVYVCFGKEIAYVASATFQTMASAGEFF